MTVNLSSQSETVKEIFGSGSSTQLYRVIPPQRRYKWKPEHARQMWEDIVLAHQQEHDAYFMGTIFLQEINGGGYRVIDGQQRLTTLSLVLAVLRDLCISEKQTGRADELHRLIVRTDNDGAAVARVMGLQSGDDEVFEYCVNDKGATNKGLPPNTASSIRVYPALKALRTQIEQFLEDKQDRSSALTMISDYLIDHVTLLPLAVEDEAQAYQVFDTTNTRGLSLTVSEQLKARLAVFLRNQPDLSKKLIANWDNAAKKFEDVHLAVDAMDNYLLVLWSSRFGYTTLNTLRKSVDDGIKNSSITPAEFIEDVGAYYNDYAAVRAPSGKDKVTEDLHDIRRMRLTQPNAFLTMVHHHAPDSFERALKAVLTLQVRAITIGQAQANKFQVNWLSWAKAVRDGHLADALSQIKENAESDEEFESTFNENGIIYDSGAARHLLRRLDLAAAPISGTHLDEVDVEHILPKSLPAKLIKGSSLNIHNRKWILDLGNAKIPESDEEKLTLGHKISSYTHKIGNQALLHQTENRGKGDRPFEEKRVGYKEMNLKLSREVGESTNWTENEIGARQKRLAELAATAWPFEAIHV